MFRRVMLFMASLAAFVLAMAMPCARLAAQNDPCYADTLRLNSGLNQVTNTLVPIGAYNLSWTVISDPDPGTSEPRPAVAITKHPAWGGPLVNTQWLSSYPTSIAPLNGPYVFQTCFCMNQKHGAPKLVMDLMADDSAAVFLNGNYVGSTTGGYTTPTHIVDVNPAHFQPGKNCLQVKVVNIGSVAMGFDLAGYVNASGVGLIKPKCCDSTGAVMGMKFNDLNCNGKQDPGEPGLPNWVIHLSNGMYDTTDALGNYYFYGLNPGTYVVNEVNQSGWTQTYPASGTYTVTVGAGQVVSAIDFGNCKGQQKDTCFLVGDKKIDCIKLPGTTQTAYSLTVWLKSYFANCPQASGTVVGVLPSGVTVTPPTFGISNVMAPVNFTISGPGAVAGATVSLILRVCCVDAAGAQRCCTDTVKVVLPSCGCFEIREQTISCQWTPNGITYQYCFDFLNMSGFTAYYFNIVPPAGVSVVPPTILYPSGVPNGTISPMQCVTISGPGAVPGSVITLLVRMCDKDRQHCCTDSIQIRLPDDCKPKDCCADFMKRFAKLTDAASSNGAAGVKGLLWAQGPGAAPIVAVSATLVSVTLNGAPAWGYFTGGAISGMGAGAVPPTPGYPFPQDITWGPMPPVNLLGNPFNLAMQFPPMAPRAWKDVLHYCIRFRFTDKNCVTCDTVICFTRVRYRFIILNDVSVVRGSTHKGAASTPQSGGSGLTFSGTINDSNSATMHVNFPQVPQGVGQVKYVGMRVTPLDSGVTIDDGATPQSGYDLFFVDGAMVAAFQADPGASADIALTYGGLAGRSSVRSHVELQYTITDSGTGETDTLTEEANFTMRRDEAKGGDVMEPVAVDLKNVRTYAVHLRNLNKSGSPITGIGLSGPGAGSGISIIAVGPTLNQEQVLLEPGMNGAVHAVKDWEDSNAVVAAGGTLGPIYLTVAGTQANAVTLTFTTYDSDGQELSTGEITLSSPLSSVRGSDGDNGSAAAASMLGQSFPNPAAYSATINFSLPVTSDEVSLVVSDASGAVVDHLIDGERLAAGDHAVFFETSKLPSGTYYYTLRVGTHVETRSMQVVK
ncbi:MAG TPA: SdrD B-like domain-containing protein [Candidatus Kapabacteria bacterium]|nr:SdrD B-like domain-containing protein [Candidatus Kapabacteria bacterium]